MTDGQPARRNGRRRSSLQRKLLLSHIRVAAIGFAILVIALAASLTLRSNALRLARERGPLVNAALQTLSGVQRSVAELSGWVAFGDVVFRERRAAAWIHDIRPAVVELERANWLWDASGDDRLGELKVMLEQLEQLQKRVERLAHSTESEGGEEQLRGIMEKDLVPLGRRVIGFLRGISAGQMALMEVDADSVILVSRVGLVLAAILLVAMTGMAWSASARGAERITEPILKLASAAEGVASGRLAAAVPVTEDDEIGQLAVAFNAMRAYLAQTTASIHETAGRLTDATAQILAATTQQAKGTREQVAALRVALGSIADVAAVSRTVVQRAQGVGASGETAVTTTDSGRSAIQEWIAGAGSLHGRIETMMAAGTFDAGSGRDVLDGLAALTDLTRNIHDAMDVLSQKLAEAERVMVETGASVGEQSTRLHEVHGAIERVDQLGEQTMQRTFHVERVAQELKAYSRALNELLAALPRYDDGPRRSA